MPKVKLSVTVDRGVLLALALRDLAENLPAVGSLTITPALLTGALAGLVGAGAGPPADAAGKGR